MFGINWSVTETINYGKLLITSISIHATVTQTEWKLHISTFSYLNLETFRGVEVKS